MASLLTTEQLDAARAIVAGNNDQLTASQVADLLSIFREYLGEALSNRYSIESTLLGETDVTNGAERCAKLVACLSLWQDDQFSNGGFAATLANRTGFNFSITEEGLRIFKYAFGLFWAVPDELVNRFLTLGGASGYSLQGSFTSLQ